MSPCCAQNDPAITCHALSAVMRRELWSLLGNPLGYVFILAFVLASSVGMYWWTGDKFFARNIADLQPMQEMMPIFLALLLPALAMGAWASEKEHGTDELLMTMPLSVVDAVLGKYLAVLAFSTIALVFSLSNVLVLFFLQASPDLGLLVSNYLGWWLCAAAFAALGVLASVLVSMPALAFVVGAAFAGLAAWGAMGAGWFEAFNRGLVPISHLLGACAVVIAALATACLVLASRRWRPASQGTVWAQVISLVCGIWLLANLAAVGDRLGIDADATSERLMSISEGSRRLLSELKEPVTIAVAISAELPPELAVKGKEIENKVKALERSSSLIRVERLRPTDSTDPDAVKAGKEFGLRTRKVVVDTVVGREIQDVFLGAVVINGTRRQVIEHFDPGLSVEYELVRAVRAVAHVKKPVLGIATTDLDISGGNMDMSMGGMSPAWEVVEEWRRQYEVRSVSLDNEVAADIKVLVVPQPSSLTQPQLEHLHDYIWAGRPTLILEDPLPFFSVYANREDLLPNRPKRSPNPYGGPPGEEGPKKGDFRKLWKGLGLDFDESLVVSSDYCPSHEFRMRIPSSIVWTSRNLGGVKDSPATTGINSLLLPTPGTIRAADDRPSTLEVRPLVTLVREAPAGRDQTEEVYERDYRSGRFSLVQQPKRRVPVGSADALAVEITGRMPSVWPRVDRSASAAEPKAGVLGEKPVHVILVADIDFMNNEFFRFYRNQDKTFNDDQWRALSDLRNVQFAANAVDALFEDKAYLEMRTRRPLARPIQYLEEKLLKGQKRLSERLQDAQNEAEKARQDAQKKMDAKLQKVREDESLDESLKEHQQTQVLVAAQRELVIDQERIARDLEDKVRDNRDQLKREVKEVRGLVKVLAVLIPAALLILLVLAVFLKRFGLERSIVPTSRKRSQA